MFNSRKSFVYDGVSLLEDYGYMLVEFEEKTDVELSLARTLDKGTVNKYKAQYDVYGVTYDSELVFPISIMKNPCIYTSREELKFTRDEIRQLAAWLTSKQVPAWLYFEDEEFNADEVRYKGLFTNIEPFVAGDIVGITLTFTCTSSYAYTHEITQEYELDSSGTTQIFQTVINNTSDEWEEYVYPTIRIYPHHETVDKGDMVIINMSDASVIDNGTLGSGTEEQSTMDVLKETIENFASTYGYTLEYETDDNDQVITRGDDHAVFLTLTEHTGEVHKCMAYYLADLSYYLVEGGFMYFTTYDELPVNIDCQKVKIYDDIGRMVLYSTMGIDDVDSFYWLRLKHGANNLLFLEKGASTVQVKYSEPRKVGELYED